MTKTLTNLKERSNQYEKSLLTNILNGTAGHVGRGFFENLVICITKAVDVKYAIVTECSNTEKTRLRTLAYASNKDLTENIEYDTENTPCKIIMEKRSPLYVPNDVHKAFSAEKGIETYVGVPILNLKSEIIGHIAVLDSEFFPFSENKIEVLKIFAVRCASEIERLNAEKKLSAALEENERLKKSLRLENSYLRDAISQNNVYSKITSESKLVKKILQLIEKVANTKSTVLITGETGTGKGVFANTIHQLSNRAAHTLVKVNCAALPKDLLESELFGHEKGAFTGALEKKAGKFEIANGSTIFLDEIGELPLEQQVKLLKVLQEKEFERVGGIKTIKTDVRVIAATNKDLELAVAKGTFRSDLYYRLNIFPIHLPPLRERKEDLVNLINFFIEKHAENRSDKMPTFNKASLKQFLEYDWPGNIRELENIIERAIILFDGKYLSLDKPLVDKSKKNNRVENKSLEEMEKEYILEILHKTNYKISGSNSASEILQVNPNTLYSKMKKLGIK